MSGRPDLQLSWGFAFAAAYCLAYGLTFEVTVGGSNTSGRGD
jgi:hypothetical protein